MTAKPKHELKVCECGPKRKEFEKGFCSTCGKIVKEAVGDRTNVNQGLLLLDKAIELTRKKIRQEAEDRGMTIEEYIEFNKLPMEK